MTSAGLVLTLKRGVVIMMPIKKDGYILCHKNGDVCGLGEVLETFRGEAWTIEGGRPPHKPASTGRVYVKRGGGMTREFFPGVFNLEWGELNDGK